MPVKYPSQSSILFMDHGFSVPEPYGMDIRLNRSADPE